MLLPFAQLAKEKMKCKEADGTVNVAAFGDQWAGAGKCNYQEGWAVSTLAAPMWFAHGGSADAKRALLHAHRLFNSTRLGLF